jgi:hypothetical protein
MTRVAIALLFLASTSSLLAQYEIRKSADGFLVVSNVPGRRFTLDVPGRQVTPYGAKTQSHPCLTVDGVFLQILSVPLAELKANTSAGDEMVLREQMQYEAKYWKVPLSQIDLHTRKVAGRTVLVWSFTPAFGPRRVQQIFLTLRSGSYVVVVGSAVQSGQTNKFIESLLARIAASFHAR